MDRGEEKHSHISNLPHPSFHVQLIHGDIESIPRNPRDIIYPVSPGSTWSTFRRCQGDLRQLMWRSSDSTMNPSQMTKFLILSVRKLISTAAVWIRRRLEGLRSSNPRLPNQLVIHWISFESFLKTANGRSETQTGSVPNSTRYILVQNKQGVRTNPSPVL